VITRPSFPLPPAAVRPGVLAAAALLLLSVPLPAAAKLGDGIKVGPGRLKLGVDADLRFDSNAGFGFGLPAATPSPALVVRGRPAFQLEVPGEDWVARARGGVDWNQYVSLGSAANLAPLSFLGVNVGADASVAQKGAVGVDLSASFVRSDRLALAAIATGGLSNAGDLRGRVRFRPGGGDNGSALEFGAWYNLGFDLFSPQATGTYAGTCSNPACDPNQISGFSWLANRVGVDAKYRPFPKTGFALEIDSGLRNHPYFANNPVPNVDAIPLRATLGFGTLLTTRFFFSVKAGYNGAFFTGANVTRLKSAAEHAFAAQVEGGLRFAEAVEGRLGFLRNMDPTSGDYGSFTTNRGYFDFRGQFAKLTAAAGISADFVAFGLRATDTATSQRNDVILALQAGLEYQVVDWMRIVGGVRFGLRQTSETALQLSGNFMRLDANLGVSTLF